MHFLPAPYVVTGLGQLVESIYMYMYIYGYVRTGGGWPVAVLLLVAEVGTTTQLDCAQPLLLPSMSRILHVTNFTCHKFYMSQILHVTNFTCHK